MNKSEMAKKIIKENFEDGCCGIFDCRNQVGDPMTTIYYEDGLCIDICYYWSYFEVFGLNAKEFDELVKFYNELRRRTI